MSKDTLIVPPSSFRRASNVPAHGFMTMQAIQEALEKHYGKPVSIYLSKGDPDNFYTALGETEVLLQVKVDVPTTTLALGKADLIGWQQAYRKVFEKEPRIE